MNFNWIISGVKGKPFKTKEEAEATKKELNVSGEVLQVPVFTSADSKKIMKQLEKMRIK